MHNFRLVSPGTIAVWAILASAFGAACGADETSSDDMAAIEAEQSLVTSDQGKCRLTMKEGTFKSLEPLLRAQPWWGNGRRAERRANRAGDRFGFPNGPAPGAGRLGPMFAYAAAPFDCPDGSCSSWQAYAVSESTGQAGLFGEELVATVPEGAFTFAYLACEKPPPSPPMSSCFQATCTGTDPSTTTDPSGQFCGATAQRLARESLVDGSGATLATIELFNSSGCEADWGQVSLTEAARTHRLQFEFGEVIDGALITTDNLGGIVPVSGLSGGNGSPFYYRTMQRWLPDRKTFVGVVLIAPDGETVAARAFEP
jgi:hypothetical protein